MEALVSISILYLLKKISFPLQKNLSHFLNFYLIWRSSIMEKIYFKDDK